MPTEPDAKQDHCTQLEQAITRFMLDVAEWHEPARRLAALQDLGPAKSAVLEHLAELNKAAAQAANLTPRDVEELNAVVREWLDCGWSVFTAALKLKIREHYLVDLSGKTETVERTIPPNPNPIDLQAFTKCAEELCQRVDRFRPWLTRRENGRQEGATDELLGEIHTRCPVDAAKLDLPSPTVRPAATTPTPVAAMAAEPGEADGSPAPAAPSKPSDDGGAPADRRHRSPPCPAAAAFQAYRVREYMGISNQAEIAKKMTENGTPATQGQVSRWLKEVDAYLNQGGALPDPPDVKPQTRSVDPTVIEMGRRTDSRKPRPSDQAKAKDQ